MKFCFDAMHELEWVHLEKNQECFFFNRMEIVSFLFVAANAIWPNENYKKKTGRRAYNSFIHTA